MMVTIAKFFASKWFGIGAAGLLLVVGGLYAYALIDNGHLSKVNAKLETAINDPKTGYVRRLAQAETNSENLAVSIAHQNAEWSKQSVAGAAKLAESERRLVVAQAATKKAEARSAMLLSRPPAGATLEARIMDVDSRILESLK